MVELQGAYFWECPTCGHANFIRATEGELPEDIAAMNNGREIDVHLETADAEACHDGEHDFESSYLLTRVLIAPSFVTCPACDHTFPAGLPAEDDDDENEEVPL